MGMDNTGRLTDDLGRRIELHHWVKLNEGAIKGGARTLGDRVGQVVELGTIATGEISVRFRTGRIEPMWVPASDVRITEEPT